MTAKEFILKEDKGYLAGDYTLNEVIYFMTEYAKIKELEQCTISGVSKRFIIEVLLNDRRLEYRVSDNEKDIEKELIELKRTYKNSNCIFHKGELNVC